MLSVLALGTAQLGNPAGNRDTDPGLLALAARAFRSIRDSQMAARDARVATFIADNGGQLSDDLERRIGSAVIAGQF